MSQWVAVSRGALDLRASAAVVDFFVLAVYPAEPIGLKDAPADLWLRLVQGPIDDAVLTESERSLVREFAEFGIASSDLEHANRIAQVKRPWFQSPQHEIVCALVASLASDQGIEVLFIKGPMLHRQGLREREHSGDVDVWVDPNKGDVLVELLTQWGWSEQHGVWDGTHVNHSVTLEPTTWGCEIDLHHHFPGFADQEEQAFAALKKYSAPAEYASVPAKVPAREAHAVIEALHLMRPTFERRPTGSQMRTAVRVLSAAGESVIEVTEQLGVAAPLHEAMATAFPNHPFDPPGELPENWVWRAKSNRAAAYLYALRMVPMPDRLRIIWRFVWPTREAALASDRLAGGSATSAARARVSRIKRGVRALRGSKPHAK